MEKKSFFLLYLVEYPNGFFTGRLLQRWIFSPGLQLCVWGFLAAMK